MTEQVISPLRRRMIEDMTIRKFAAKTQHDYVQRVKDFAVFLGRSPDTARAEDVRRFQLHLASTDAGRPKINVTVSALRFFFNVTLGRTDLAKPLATLRQERKVPVILSAEEVARLLEAAPSLKYKAALSVAYGAGLRVSEAVALKVSDIDSKRRLKFCRDHAPLAETQTFAAYLAPLRKTEWVVYAKKPFGGPRAVLAYLSRYTHRVAIANSRLLALDDKNVTFKWKDYRSKAPDRYKAMKLAIAEFIRRFLIHVLPKGFHRIRHYGLFAQPSCADNITRARQLLALSQVQDEVASPDATKVAEPPVNRCSCCGGRMIIIERFKRGAAPHHQPTAPIISIRIDSS